MVAIGNQDGKCEPLFIYIYHIIAVEFLHKIANFIKSHRTSSIVLTKTIYYFNSETYGTS